MIRVLLVDGDNDAEAVVARLAARGLSVDIATDGATATTRLRQEHYDVVVLDPEVLGNDLATFLGWLQSRPRPRAVVIAATTDPSDPLRPDSDIAVVIRKPYDVELLVHVVRASAPTGGTPDQRDTPDKKPIP